MAIVVTPKQQYVVGDRLTLIVDITGDTSYPTNGTVILPANQPGASTPGFGMTELDFVDTQLPLAGTRIYKYDYTNNKLKAFSAFGTEVTNATNCSADTIRCVIVGKGFPVIGV